MSNLKLIQELRSLTAAGLADCKTALTETNWDLEKAIDYIKAKNLNIVSRLSGKSTSEGTIAIAHDSNLNVASIVELNCETDFVARSPEFLAVANNLAQQSLQTDKIDTSSIDSLIASTKENITLARYATERGKNSNHQIFTYLHPNRQVGVLLLLHASLETMLSDSIFQELGENLTMQIASMNPLIISRQQLSTELIEKNSAIFRDQIIPPAEDYTGDIEKYIAKILTGKLNKWYREVVLLEQDFVLENKLSVHQKIDSVEQKLGGKIEVVKFFRFKVGDISLK